MKGIIFIKLYPTSLRRMLLSENLPQTSRFFTRIYPQYPWHYATLTESGNFPEKGLRAIFFSSRAPYIYLDISIWCFQIFLLGNKIVSTNLSKQTTPPIPLSRESPARRKICLQVSVFKSSSAKHMTFFVETFETLLRHFFKSSSAKHMIFCWDFWDIVETFVYKYQS